MSDPSSIAVDRSSGRVAVVCRGEFDLPTEQPFDRAVENAIATNEPVVEIDLRDIDFFGVCGVGLLMRSARRIEDAGLSLRVAANARVRRVLDLAGVTEVLEIRE